MTCVYNNLIQTVLLYFRDIFLQLNYNLNVDVEAECLSCILRTPVFLKWRGLCQR